MRPVARMRLGATCLREQAANEDLEARWVPHRKT